MVSGSSVRGNTGGQPQGDRKLARNDLSSPLFNAYAARAQGECGCLAPRDEPASERPWRSPPSTRSRPLRPREEGLNSAFSAVASFVYRRERGGTQSCPSEARVGEPPPAGASMAVSLCQGHAAGPDVVKLMSLFETTAGLTCNAVLVDWRKIARAFVTSLHCCQGCWIGAERAIERAAVVRGEVDRQRVEAGRNARSRVLNAPSSQASRQLAAIARMRRVCNPGQEM
jgi:hypothetical protein